MAGDLSRRELLRDAAAAAAALSAGGALAPLPAGAAPRRRVPPSRRGRRVAVLGGGMAGLAAAHELRERGFAVDVYERKALGGKARSIPVPGTARGGRRALPGEHGFRFFPGFYHHVPDTMRRIPFGGNPNGVWDNLVDANETRSPRTRGRAKQRSVHNNYLTLPVVLAMISPHFPIALGHEHAWAVIVSLMAVGAWIRHYFNLRHRGLNVWPIPVSAAVALVAIAIAIKPDDEPARAAPAGSVDFARVQTIVAERCAPCHSARPTQPGFTAAPGGVELDTPDQVAAQAEAIEQQAVDSRAMPLGNVTGMTDVERAELAAWLSAGAPTR